MAKELSSIIAQAAQVRNAQLTAENTAERVGGVLCDLLEYLTGLITAGDIQLVADLNGTGLTITFRNSAGIPIARRLNIPVVSSSANGLLSPELLTKLNAAYTKSGTNQTAIETRRLEIAELTERLKGRSQYSNAFTDPKIFLGDFDTIEEVNATIDGLVTQAASPETKYTGHCIVGHQVARNVLHAVTATKVDACQRTCNLAVLVAE